MVSRRSTRTSLRAHSYSRSRSVHDGGGIVIQAGISSRLFLLRRRRLSAFAMPGGLMTVGAEQIVERTLAVFSFLDTTLWVQEYAR